MDKQNEKFAILLMSWSLAFVFLYAGISAVAAPYLWDVYFPSWMFNFIPSQTLIIIFSVFQILLAGWILSRKKLYYSSIVSAVILFLIIASNIGNFDLVFRDVGSMVMAVSIAVLSKGLARKK